MPFLSTDNLKGYSGPRGNISQGGGAFLNHKESAVTERVERVPGYRGHRPFLDVEPRPVSGGRISSFHFDDNPEIRSARDLPFHRQPNRQWVDNRATAAAYDDLRSYRDEVGGVVPGYKGHMPGALRKIGGSKYGNIVVRDEQPEYKRWAQARHEPDTERRRPASGKTVVDMAADGIVQRSGGQVPRHQAIAATHAAVRAAHTRVAQEAKIVRDANQAEQRLKTESGIINRGVCPGYKGHVPRFGDEIGISAYHGRGADSHLQLGHGIRPSAKGGERVYREGEFL